MNRGQPVDPHLSPAAPLMATPRRSSGRIGMSAVLSGTAAALVGLVSVPAASEAARVLEATVAGAPGALGPWETLGMGGVALAWALWSVREAGSRRLEEAQGYAQDLQEKSGRYATDLAAQHELRLQEARAYAEAIERIYTAATARQEQLVAAYRSQVEDMRGANERLLEALLGRREDLPAP